ncbi:MAG: glycosyltransferase family 4 protein [Patescibacteria group bacterium]
MKVGVDIRILGKGRRTGVEDYTINLLSHLLSVDRSNKYRLFYNGFRRPKLDYSWLKFRNVKLKVLRFPNRIFDLFLRFLRIPKIDKILNGVDLFLSPHFLLTPLSKSKLIVIFYDLSFVRFPEFFSLPKLLWHKFIYPRKQAQKADLVITISRSTKDDLINLYKIKPEKIKVIYPGIDEKFRPVKRNEPALIKIKEKYKLPDKFILYFGTIEPRKNLLGLIRAFEQIKEEKDLSPLQIQWRGFEGLVKEKQKEKTDLSDLKLVIAGSRGWLYKEVFKKVKDSLFGKDIIFTGFVEEEDKPYLYNLADVFVYPSFFEGFGLPPLEAMACGVPTIVSNKSSLPEVVGDSAIMVDPHNINEISFIIRRILEDQSLKDYLIDQGLKRVRKFNWNKVASEFLNIFKHYAHWYRC